MKSLFLVSGGLDSTSGMFRYKDIDYDCMIINYGQRSYRQQRKYAEINCNKLEKKLIVLDARGIGEAFNRDKTLIPHEPILHRNAAIIPIVLVYASERGYSDVYVFIVSEECKYEPNKPKVLSLLSSLAETLNVKLVFPFIGLPKAQVLKIGMNHGMNPANTYSCILGHRCHCGKCSQCEARKQAFINAGVKDETVYM
ncbi:MAG: 7-cyano-7-deazaguanine synthase [Metallosphaera sp.]|uniref:7-cyano-7-deazaguanine synthase n=1 Tax=Metallosphaera cuprina (strain Ar-4) TaxID=1006006 RepID=F4G1F6_METCR|nr:7-cyano-7-deazaguanine synthase [Metallosphaera cuprina]AEB94769.1 ExsB family protein [Metallosphaera cuprina Ar-4]